jgi:ElaB/YqjD/DUF883 family membrane-anchored ribosome-binding protein
VGSPDLRERARRLAGLATSNNANEAASSAAALAKLLREHPELLDAAGYVAPSAAPPLRGEPLRDRLRKTEDELEEAEEENAELRKRIATLLKEKEALAAEAREAHVQAAYRVAAEDARRAAATASSVRETRMAGQRLSAPSNGHGRRELRHTPLFVATNGTGAILAVGFSAEEAWSRANEQQPWPQTAFIGDSLRSPPFSDIHVLAYQWTRDV